jgi:hypothetical protein
MFHQFGGDVRGGGVVSGLEAHLPSAACWLRLAAWSVATQSVTKAERIVERLDFSAPLASGLYLVLAPQLNSNCNTN